MTQNLLDGELTEHPEIKHFWFYLMVVIVHTLPYVFMLVMGFFFLIKFSDTKDFQIQVLYSLLISSGVFALILSAQSLRRRKKWLIAFQVFNILIFGGYFIYLLNSILKYDQKYFDPVVFLFLIPVLSFPLLTWLSIKVSKSWFRFE